MPKSEIALTHWQHIVSACLGAITTSLTMTPLDVAKTRLQAQKPVQLTSSAQLASSCSRFQFCNGLEDFWCEKCQVRTPFKNYKNTFDVLIKIWRHEGVLNLWRGLAPTLIHSIPTTVLYFNAYDVLHMSMIPFTPSWISPLLAGAIARVCTVTMVAPLELLRTRIQASRGVELTVMSGFRSEFGRAGGILNLWRGLGPTLFRDVPFSAVYWSCYELFKSVLTRASKKIEIDLSPSTLHHFAIPCASGAISGTISAISTNPFDVVKTRRQVELYQITGQSKSTTTTWKLLARIIREEGFKGLSIGIGPRIAKVAPACAIMISSYEFSKYYFRLQNS